MATKKITKAGDPLDVRFPKPMKSGKSVQSKRNTNYEQVIQGARHKGHVQDFGDLVQEQAKKSILDYAGTNIFIVKLEKKFSDNYGDGYVVSFKDYPNAQDTMTAGVYGTIPAKQLDTLYQVTNEGRRISLTDAVGTFIEEVPTKKGMSYRFAPMKK